MGMEKKLMKYTSTILVNKNQTVFRIIPKMIIKLLEIATNYKIKHNLNIKQKKLELMKDKLC